MVVKYDKTPAHSAALLLPERSARQSEAIWQEAKQIDGRSGKDLKYF